MPTTETAVMTTQEVADRFYELCKSYNWEGAQDELYDKNAVSIEPPDSPGLYSVEGLDEIKKKGVTFNNMVEEMHGGYVNEPIVAGKHFAVAMGMDVTMKGMGRSQMDEIAVYEVKDGKIVKEQFFF
ncbi:MAG TPA: nuclear transport factor 2 family protein [Flavitalea sp.]|nr:nuclear transport factor 2 family protein [Flavitalea sp.]